MRVGEVGHLVSDIGVLLCPCPLGNKFCPVEWTALKKCCKNLVLMFNLQIFQAFLTTTLVALKTPKDHVLKICLNPQFKIMHKFHAQSNLD